MLRWLIRTIGLTTLLTMILLFIVSANVVLGLASVGRGLDTGLLLAVANLGWLAGWRLAKSGLRGWVAAPLAVTLGVAGIVYRLANLGGPLAATLARRRRACPAGWRLAASSHARPTAPPAGVGSALGSGGGAGKPAGGLDSGTGRRAGGFRPAGGQPGMEPGAMAGFRLDGVGGAPPPPIAGGCPGWPAAGRQPQLRLWRRFYLATAHRRRAVDDVAHSLHPPRAKLAGEAG